MAMKERYYTVDGLMIGYKTAAGRKDFLTDALGSVTAEVDQTGSTKTFDGRYKPYGGDLSSAGIRGSYGEPLRGPGYLLWHCFTTSATFPP